MSGPRYFEPTDESLLAVVDFLADGGPFLMLNLFRLRDEPDFSEHPEMEPSSPAGCRALFHRYIAEMDAHLEAVGAERIFLADGGPSLVGPPGEQWDVVQIVRYPSGQALLELGARVRDEVMLRSVMLADSRVMPVRDLPLDIVRDAR